MLHSKRKNERASKNSLIDLCKPRAQRMELRISMKSFLLKGKTHEKIQFWARSEDQLLIVNKS